jgi:paraquat-inducible protein B
MTALDPGSPAQRTVAAIRHSRWPGWIWAVPLAALAIGLWLGIGALATGGVDVTVVFDQGAGMQPGNTEVVYRGLKVGELKSLTLDSDGTHVLARLAIDQSAKKFLARGARFWLQGGRPSLGDPASLKAIIAGPTIMLEPGRGAPERSFVGVDHKPAILGPQGEMVTYALAFDGPVGNLKVDAPVKLRGFTVGEVRKVGFYFDAAHGTIATPVTIVLDPRRFHIRGATRVSTNRRAFLNGVLNQMISAGMRAQMTQDPPFIGSYQISLEYLTGSSPAKLDTSNPELPLIPTQSTAAGKSIIQKADEVPIDKIAGRILDIADHIDQIVASPALQQSVVHLERTLASLNRTADRAGPQITQLVTELRQTANEMDTATAAANRLLGGSPAYQQNNLQTAVQELTATARSLRALADYLNRHPRSLLTGPG